jgi:hypothetical protein
VQRTDLAIVCFGVRIGVRVDRSEALQGLTALLPPGWKRSSSRQLARLYSLRLDAAHERTGRCALYVDGELLIHADDPTELLRSFERDLRVFVAQRARRHLFVHAGAVGWGDAAILLPGRSHSGKTTLVAELIRAGASYYSDEYALLDPRGRVHPFPVPLSVRAGKAAASGRFPAEQFGAVRGERPLPVGLVVASEYRPGASWRPRRLSPGCGALELLANTVSARARPAAALSILAPVVRSAPVLKGVRGEVEPVVRKVLDALSAGSSVVQ